MPRAKPRRAIKKIADELGKQAAQLVFDRLKPFVTSAALRRSMYVMKEKRSGSYRIVFPQFWAIYYHNGRDAITAAPGKFLVYFPDPRNDPRLKAGYPTLKKQVRHLTAAQFAFGVKMNKKLEKQGRGTMAYMVFTRHVGPARAHPFIKEALGRFPANILRQVGIKFHQTVQDLVPKGKKTLRVKWG